MTGVPVDGGCVHMQVKGATYDARAVRNLLLLGQQVERSSGYNLIIDIVT